MRKLHGLFAGSILLLITGCAKPHGASLQHLDPHAPAAQGYPAYEGPLRPTPLAERPLFGIMAVPPTPEAIALLATATPSPNGRYRAALTPQGLWVTRVDGAWLWQVQLPAPPPPPAPTAAPGATPPPPPPTAKPPDPIGPITWSTRSTVVFKDTSGTWYEADPDLAGLAPLPPALQGKQMITYSPDGKQLLYYTPTPAGTMLWVANVDGSNAKMIGANLVGGWDTAGKLVSSHSTPSVPTPPAPNPPVGSQSH